MVAVVVVVKTLDTLQATSYKLQATSYKLRSIRQFRGHNTTVNTTVNTTSCAPITLPLHYLQYLLAEHIWGQCLPQGRGSEAESAGTHHGVFKRLKGVNEENDVVQLFLRVWVGAEKEFWVGLGWVGKGLGRGTGGRKGVGKELGRSWEKGREEKGREGKVQYNTTGGFRNS